MMPRLGRLPGADEPEGRWLRVSTWDSHSSCYAVIHMRIAGFRQCGPHASFLPATLAGEIGGHDRPHQSSLYIVLQFGRPALYTGQNFVGRPATQFCTRCR